MRDQEARRKDLRREVFTIPNGISLIRLLLIPVIVYTYMVRHDLPWTLVAIGLSGLSDVLDGAIARRFHMVSDVGKVLDPVADKLTQGALVICLCQRQPVMIALFALLLVKELTQGVFGLMTVRHGLQVSSSRWYGKACTVIIYFSMLLILVWETIPQELVWVLVGLCAAALILSLTMYIRYFGAMLRGKPDGKDA